MAAPHDEMAPRGRLLSGTKAAARLGISYWALLRQIRAKQIAVVRTSDSRLMGIYETDCDDWVARRRTPVAGVEHEPSRLARQPVDDLVEALVPANERVIF